MSSGRYNDSKYMADNFAVKSCPVLYALGHMAIQIDVVHKQTSAGVSLSILNWHAG